MEAKGRTLELPSDVVGAMERSGSSRASTQQHESTLQSILSDIQGLVEKSDITNRAQHVDSARYLESSPREAEIGLLRTVLSILGCRYRPAQLNVTAMAKQLEEAEDYRRCVLEQVAGVSGTTVCDPEAQKAVEGRWSAALLDASATVQVKAAQLDQVTLYHKQTQAITALLEDLAAETEKLSLDVLGSSALQVESLHTLLLIMEQKKGMMVELLQLSSQLLAHLSEAESSGALLAQIGDLQEEWRLVEGAIRRSLRHASISSSQYSLLLREAELLQAKLEDLQKSTMLIQSSQTHPNIKSTLDIACLATDQTIYNQHYLHLQSKAEALGLFSLCCKEKEEMERFLQGLRSLLKVTKSQFDTYSPSVGNISSKAAPLAKINTRMKDLFIWARQAENHITVGKKMALFPEEARTQIAQMKNLQYDILSRRSKMKIEVEEIKAMASDMDMVESDHVLISLKIVEELYETTADSSAHVLEIMEDDLVEREKLLSQLAGMDTWLAEAHIKRDPFTHVESASEADIPELERRLRFHQLATEEVERQLALVDILTENSQETAVGLSPAESRYLVNRLTGLWIELNGIAAHEQATSWELEELIHERTSSDEELATVQASLKKISTDLEPQTFPLTKDTLSTTELLKHMLMEHQCHIQELQHCQEAERSSLLCIIGELQEKAKVLSIHALEHEKYLNLLKQMEDSRDIAKARIERSKDKSLSVGERFRLCQTLLVELPLVKTQCQEAADQLEAIAQDFYPSQLTAERQRIRHTVETLVSWEHTVTDNIKSLERKLLEGLRFCLELPALMNFLQRSRQELELAEPMEPDEKAIDIKLRRCWVIWRSLESGVRVLEALGKKEKMDLRTYGELYMLRDATMTECHSCMDSLSQAREALKDYHWAAQGAIAFLRNAETTFLSPPGGFLDCSEEQSHTQQALTSIEDGLQAHISHLVELVPRQACLSLPVTEQLHIGIMSHLLVGRAILEAQAQLRLEALQRCVVRQPGHRKCHEDIRKLLSMFEVRLSQCAAEEVTSYDECVDQQNRAKALLEELPVLAGKLEELRAGCPMQGCGVGKEGELGALWRYWASLRGGVSLLLARSDQRGEEWRDIATSMEQCCSSLASLQAKLPDFSTLTSTQGGPQELLHRAEVEQEQQALASLKLRLTHLLDLSSPQDAGSPAAPVGRWLEKIQEGFRSLKEQSMQEVTAAVSEEQHRRWVQEETEEVEQRVLTLLSALVSCTNLSQQQELREDLSSQRARLQCIMDGVQSGCAVVPADVDRSIRDVQLSLQKAEEKVLQSLERNSLLNKMSSRVVEVQTGLEGVRTLLEQRSLTFTAAQHTLKCVWDELDSWHSRLALLEVEVQDVAEEQPEQAHLLMDRLTQPLQLYQNTAQMAEQRTAFLSKIPTCLQEFEDMLHSATCWLEEAQSWLSAPCTYTTARSLHSYANSLQLVLDDSERIRATLGNFGPLLKDISAVYDTTTLEERLASTDHQVDTMQHNIVGPLEQLVHAAVEVDALETEVKTMEKNVTKIRAILSTMDTADIPLEEHLRNRQVIVANLQAMRRTVEEMETCKGELGLPPGAEENLAFYARARLLLQPLQELEQLNMKQAAELENKVKGEVEATEDVCVTTTEPSECLGDTECYETLEGHSFQEDFEACPSEEEEEEKEEEERPPSSSSDTLTCSVPEDPDDDSLRDQELEETDAPTMESHSEDVPEAHALPGDEVYQAGWEEHREQMGVTASHDGVAEESNRRQETSETQSSIVSRLAEEEEEEEGEEEQTWSELYVQISQKLNALRQIQEGILPSVSSEAGGTVEKAPERKLMMSVSVSVALQKAQECSDTLRLTHTAHCTATEDCSADGSSLFNVRRKLYSAVRQLLVGLDSWTGLLFSPVGASMNEGQLRLLQQECLSLALVSLGETLSSLSSEVSCGPLAEEPESVHCLTCIQECLHTTQKQLHARLGLAHQYQAGQEQAESLVCIVEEFGLGQSDQFTNLNYIPNIEDVIASPLRESPEEKAKLHQVSAALLQGLASLAELAEEECVTANQASQLHNHSQLQALLNRHKRVFQVLGSQVAFLQHLFQREPHLLLESQEEDWVRLESRVTVLQQQALEQGVVAQRRLQEWSQWEADCGRLGRLLEGLEALIPSGEPEEEGGEEVCSEGQTQDRLDACQRVLACLVQRRAVLGSLLDSGRTLQTAIGCSPSVNLTVGALELRWRSVRRRAEQEVQRCRDILDSWASFQKNSVSLNEWLAGAHRQLEAWLCLAHTTHLDQEQAHSHLTQLLDFSLEVEAWAAQKESSARSGARLLQLREAGCPGHRMRRAQLELSWSQLTSGLPKAQEGLLQQLLQAGWPPLGVLGDVESWVSKLSSRLYEEERERERLLCAPNAAQLSQSLQRYQELEGAVASGQLTLDFLCQSGPQVAGADSHALHTECRLFAERLGALNMRWLELQGDLRSQIRMTEQMHHVCADRERRLRRLHSWVTRQTDLLEECRRPVSQTLALKALLEWEAVEERVKEVREELQELRATCVRVREEKQEVERSSDADVIKQIDDVSRACASLSQQMEVLRPALQLILEEWSCFEKELSEAALHTTRVRCTLQHQRAPLLSPHQATGYVEGLEQLQEKVGKWEELWAAVDQSYQRLRSAVNHGAAQLLTERMKGERTRWKETLQEVKDELLGSREVLSLWQEYTRLSDCCSFCLQHLQHQWEALSSSPRAPQPNTQAEIDSVEKLQDGVNDLQSSMGDLLVASKPLIGRLEPPAANFIQSETRLLSRDVLLLRQALAGKREDLEQQERFCTSLEALEKQIQIPLHRLTTSVNDTHSVKKIVVELNDLLPALVDLTEMSRCVSPGDPEADRLSALTRLWVEGLARGSDMCRETQAEVQRSQNFQEKCDSLTAIQKKIEEDLVAKPAGSHSNLQDMLLYSNLQDMLLIHQRHQVDIMVGHQLLQGLICDAVGFLETGTDEEKRSELMAEVGGAKERWWSTVALADQSRAQVKGLLGQWRLYSRSLRLLQRLLKDMDPLLPPAGLAVCSLKQLRSSVDDYQRVEETLGSHAVTYSQTLEAGRQLCASLTESPSRGQLQREILELQEAWQRTVALLGKRRALVHTVLQSWERCQDGLADIAQRLDGVRSSLKQPLPERLERPEEEENVIQEKEVSLERAAGGLREMTTARTDLSRYVATRDTALLGERLKILHCQWNDLCTKVSLRRQEIADHLNAWTIFNDKNKELCDWLTQMENKVSHSGDLSIEEMVEKLKKDCMEEMNLFSENKSHLKQLGEQLLLASDQAKQTQLHGSLREVNRRWHDLFLRIEARVRKLKETLVTMQQLYKNMANLRCWLARMEAELWRPVTYSVCHHQEIQRRLAEQQELQRDIEQHTAGVASVLSLCDVLLRDEDAACSDEAESDSLQETSRSLDQRWRTICTMAMDRRLRIEETWRLWCKFLDDYSRFEDWLKMAEHTAANPKSADVLYTVAKEELKKFEGFQRQVHERLTQLELVNHQYRRLARENRTDRASQLKAMVHEGNRRWDTLHRRVAAILRRLKYFTSQREDFEGTRESMLVWLTEMDLQLTNVEHFSESDVHHKMQQLNSFQKEITLNTELMDGLIVFGEVLIQRSSPLDAALIEEELEELHSYCQEVFSRLVRFHQRLSQPPTITVEPELSTNKGTSLESSSELVGRPWLGRSQGGLPATPTQLLAYPLERSGRETPVSVDSLPLEWDHTGDVGGSSSHEEEEEEEEDGMFFSALSEIEVEVTESQEEYVTAMEGPALGTSSLGVIERWELLQAQSRSDQQAGPRDPQQLTSDLGDITSWLGRVTLELERLQQSDPAATIQDMEEKVKQLKEMQKAFARYKSVMLSVNLDAHQLQGCGSSVEAQEQQEGLGNMNQGWSHACAGLEEWESSLRKTLMHCQEFHETLHSLLLWLAHAESRHYAVDIQHPDTPPSALYQHCSTLSDLQEELRCRQSQLASLQTLWSQLQPEEEEGTEESGEAKEKLHVTSSKLRLLQRQVAQDLSALQQRLDCEAASPSSQSSSEGEGAGRVPSSDASQEDTPSQKGCNSKRLEKREPSPPPRSFFYRVLRAAFPLHLLLLVLLVLLVLLTCLVPLPESDPGCTPAKNNFARSFHPMLRYTNGPPPT